MNNPDLIPIVNLISDKRGNNKEFFINFFEKCNLRCAFCWQDHDSETGMTVSEITGKADIVIKNTYKGYSYDINIMGGELLMDEIDDGIFDSYYIFAKRVHDGLYNKEIYDYTINIVTNLIFKNTSRVDALMYKLRHDGIKFSLVTSYDPTGRFNINNLETFKHNIEHYRDLITNISVVLTKPNINYLLHSDDSYVKYLYENFPLFFDYYSPEKNKIHFQPNNKELVDFYLFLLEKYPNSYPIKSFLNNYKNNTTCRSSLIILPNNEVGSCKILTTDEKSGVGNIHDLEYNFLNKYKCLECEYYNKCGLHCFLHDNDLNTDNTCHFKFLYKNIEENIK